VTKRHSHHCTFCFFSKNTQSRNLLRLLPAPKNGQFFHVSCLLLRDGYSVVLPANSWPHPVSRELTSIALEIWGTLCSLGRCCTTDPSFCFPRVLGEKVGTTIASRNAPGRRQSGTEELGAL